MKIIVLLFFCLMLSFEAVSQQKANAPLDSCLLRLSSVSFFWKKDSVAQNGYRLSVYKGLLSCNYSNMTSTILFEKLGQPNRISQHSKGVGWLYYYYDGKMLPVDSGLAPERGYIIFNFDLKSKYLLNVGEGHFD
ncbi:MAG: hypothetical protein IPP99_11085 [Chitinophagaceae bacterium]|nr:hypothetical protein [Chitinophagaceae bacterium]